MAHGCEAGLQQEACDKVYFARIARGNEACAIHKHGVSGLGLGAVACLFEQTCSRLSSASPIASGRLPDATGRLPVLPLIDSCRAVSQRAAQTLRLAESNNWLLGFGLHHLTLGRAVLYEAILERSAALRAAATPNDPAAMDSSDAFFPADAAADDRPALLARQSARRELDAAVDGLRRSGNQDHLPRGLLTRALLRFLTGARTGPESVQADAKRAILSP